MKQDRKGWWLVAGLAALTLLGLYVMAYYATVQPGLSIGSRRDVSRTLTYQPHYGRLGSVGEFIFRPMYLIDRQLRPAFWSEQIDERPYVPAGY